MGRPSKKGLSYTFLSVDFFNDLKIKRLVRRTGLKHAPMVYQAVILAIYAEGYYIAYHEDLPFVIADQLGIDEEDVSIVLDACFEIDLLSKDMYAQHGILTSHRIQCYYNEVCSATHKRHAVTEFSLLEDDDIPDSFARHNVPENAENDGNGELSRAKPQLSRAKPQLSRAKVHEENRIEKKRKEISSFSLTPFPLAEDKEDQKKESPPSVLYYLTFERNMSDPNREMEKIRSYNSLKGKPWDSMSAQQQVAAAALWQQNPPRPPRYSPGFLVFLRKLYDTLRIRHPSNPDIEWLLSDSMREGVTDGDTYTLSVTQGLHDTIESDRTVLALLRKFIGRRLLYYNIVT